MKTPSLLRRIWMAAPVVIALFGALPAIAQSPAGQPGPTPLAPIYARYIGADKLWRAPYNLTGKGDTLGLFEFAGGPLLFHPELQHLVPRSNHVAPEDQKPDLHATQVIGVITGKGIDAAHRGVARDIHADFYIADNGGPNRFLAEVGKRKWRVSNHSYGPDYGWINKKGLWIWEGVRDGSPNQADREDPAFGHYGQMARSIDSLINKLPQQVAVFAAGNQRGIGPGSGENYIYASNDGPQGANTATVKHPKNGGTNGYDVLSGMGTAKNGIVVGGVDSLNQLWANSNTGPTDDGRVKPDVVALASDVPLVCTNGSVNSGYSVRSGTSFAAPAVAGTLMLLDQYWQKFNPAIPFTAAVARGLLIHTARDIDKTGPDYRTGWGKVEANTAADLIQLNSTNNGFSIRQATLKQGETYEFYIKAYSGARVRATMAWTDPPAAIALTPNGRIILNDRTSKLVNDLDMRMYQVFTNGTVKTDEWFSPFVLDPAKPTEEADRGDNVVDNVEQIYFRANNVYLPGKFDYVYKVVIKHKGTLTGGKQDFALLVSGAAEVLLPPTNVKIATGRIAPKGGADFAANSAFVTWAGAPGATHYDVRYLMVGSPTWTAINNVSKTEAKLDNLQAATYQVQVRARHGAVVSPWTTVVEFYGSTPVRPAEVWITQQKTTSGVVNWSAVSGATQYEVKWARVAGDNTVLGGWYSKVVNGTSTTISNLYPDQYYAVYVRTKYPNNLLSDYSDGVGFWTSLDCNSYEPNNTALDARKIRVGDYADGKICKGDKEDWFIIYNPSGLKNLQVTFYAHSKPLKLTIYRQPINGGTISVVPNTTITNNGTQSVKVNNADFATYNYYVQVWVNDPNITFSDTEPYTIIATTKATPYQAHWGDGAPTPSAKPIAGETEQERGGIQLYPNPATSNATVSFNGVPSGSNVRLRVYDASGSVAYSAQGVVSPIGTILLPTEGLPAGAYMVEAIANNQRLTSRLMVAR